MPANSPGSCSQKPRWSQTRSQLPPGFYSARGGSDMESSCDKLLTTSFTVIQPIDTRCPTSLGHSERFLSRRGPARPASLPIGGARGVCVCGGGGGVWKGRATRVGIPAGSAETGARGGSGLCGSGGEPCPSAVLGSWTQLRGEQRAW